MLVIGDADQHADLSDIVADVDHIVYALGASSPAASVLDPVRDICEVVSPLVGLLEVLRQHPRVIITFLSSGGAVYGNSNTSPIPENVPLQPISAYGILKLTAERYLSMYANNFDLNLRILRVSNAYGPGEPWASSQGLIGRLFRCATTGESLPLYGASGSIRDFIYIGDVARVVAELATLRAVPTVLNVGTGIGHGILEVADLISEVTGLPIHTERFAARSFDVAANILDCTRLSRTIRHHPISLRAGLQRTWAAADYSPATTARAPLGAAAAASMLRLTGT
jgi:UDP-glucose 4-epimerase